jgi:ubiquinone/menaquinone biosynthesis C-methylase UbiE
VTLDFDPLAADYDRLRPTGRAWDELSERTLAVLGDFRRLLDVGCGTGRFAAFAKARRGGRVWGVDPSPEMLSRARARPDAAGIGWKQAAAERLPFTSGWFDAAHMHLVVHTLADRPAALAEIGRVLMPDGRIAIATFAKEHFARFLLNPYFPSIASIDGARFPDPAALTNELEAAGFRAPAIERISQPVSADPRDVLERVRGRYISTLHLLEPGEYADGLARLERDVAAGRGPFAYSLEWALVTATRE